MGSRTGGQLRLERTGNLRKPVNRAKVRGEEKGLERDIVRKTKRDNQAIYKKGWGGGRKIGRTGGKVGTKKKEKYWRV